MFGLQWVIHVVYITSKVFVLLFKIPKIVIAIINISLLLVFDYYSGIMIEKCIDTVVFAGRFL